MSFNSIVILLSLSLNFQFAHALVDSEVIQKSSIDDKEKINSVLTECNHIKDYIVKNKYTVNCNNQFILFGNNLSNFKAVAKPTLKIANYNLLHPGTSKTLYKDYSLLARVANTFDFVSAQEVLSMVGHDAQVNADLDAYIEAKNGSSTNVSAAMAIYRTPGYFKLLTELKKLDPSWSLILSPRGDAALQGSVEEHVGFFFRSSIITPRENSYCKNSACIINLGVNNKFVSRRPFMGSFKAGKFNFTVVSSHVVYNYSGDEASILELVSKVFKVKTIDEIGPGVNSVNFARFAEVKLTLEFIKNYSKTYNDSKVIFSSDTNLTPELGYWESLLKINAGSALLINEPTTISPQRFNKDNEETLGVANSYDHFVLNKKEFSNCNAGEVYNYYKSTIATEFDKNYKIQPDISLNNVESLLLTDEDPAPPESDPTKLDYPLTKIAEVKMNNFIGNYKKYLSSLKVIRDNKIVPDDFLINERLDGLKNRLFLKQLTNAFYYRYHQEVLSDHFPAYITCNL